MKSNERKESSANYNCVEQQRARRAGEIIYVKHQYIFFVQPEVRVQRVLEVSKIMYHFLPPIGRFCVPQNPMTPYRRLQAHSD